MQNTHMHKIIRLHTGQRYSCKEKATWLKSISAVSTSTQRIEDVQEVTRIRSIRSFQRPGSTIRIESPCVQALGTPKYLISAEDTLVQFLGLIMAALQSLLGLVCWGQDRVMISEPQESCQVCHSSSRGAERLI